jgi:DNA mismatch repair ATPase MutS
MDRPRPTNATSRPNNAKRSALPDTGNNSKATTVPNDVSLGHSVMILTGANMSGKSTLMRSVMAVALLGNVGLPVPCEKAQVPQV